MRKTLMAGLALVALLCSAAFGAGDRMLEADDFVVVSGAASPRVAFAVDRDDERLWLVLETATFADGAGISASVGVAAAKKVVLTNDKPVPGPRRGVARFLFDIPINSIAPQPADLGRLRLAFAVAWAGGPFGTDRQRERFRHVSGAPHAGLSPDESDWLPFDLGEHEALVSDRKNRIRLDFQQPMDGKATIVIEDQQGNRVRNLVAGVPMPKGTNRIEWDGLDESGRVVAPGVYTWRAISHPGITPNYLFSFCNDGQPPWRTGSGRDMWGPDHSCLTAATAGDTWTFLGGSCAESGYAMVAVDETGTKRMHYNAIHGTGLAKVALASAGNYLYAAHDGLAWGERIDKTKPDWKAQQKLTITRYDVATGRSVDYPGKGRFAVVDRVEFGPGSTRPDWTGTNLSGLAILGGKLYVGCRASDSLLVLDAETCNELGRIKLESPGTLAAGKDAIYAACRAGANTTVRPYGGMTVIGQGAVIVRISPAGGTPETVVAADAVSPAGIAVDAAGSIYASDSATSTVKVFDSQGKLLREIGKPGGSYQGKYDPERFVNPCGIAIAPNGRLWVTENRGNPKRASAWNVKTGKLVKEKFGPTAYGASGAGFDYADHTSWIGQGATWKLDFAKKSAACRSILSESSGHAGGYESHGYTFVRQDGRTFVIGSGGVATISELRRDGSRRDLAFVGSTHRYCYACGWNPPAEFVEAFNAAYPGRKGKHADKGPGVLWADKNGDGKCQADEFDFSTECDNFAGGYWGHLQRDLTIRVPATVKGKRVLAVLQPEGFTEQGVPQYPKLNDACAAAVPVALDGNEIETAADRFGNVVCNSDPQMKCFAPDGTLRWTYPNRWSNVHGSHGAPLPEIAMMQGALYFLGMTPFDEQADVFVMNGNHGRFFVITSDGFYLDEMFKDVRMGSSTDAYLIGGECFGGFFSKSEDGNFYLQSGHTDYRIFRIDGLDKAKRSSGRINVSARQAAAAENSLKRKVAQESAPREAAIPLAAKPPVIDGKDDDWPAAITAQWDKSGRFPVKVRCSYDAAALYLYYEVEDESPWVNNGKDWTMLFKTGDSVDVQLGADATANPKRSGPVPGDLRLLIAPYDGGTIAVLYRHRVPGTKDPVEFVSPWRSEKVDVVAKLEGVAVAVLKEKGWYRLEAAIPLDALHCPDPAGKALKADFGVLYGDRDGAMTLLRSYWSNQLTNLVNDVPGEIMLAPGLWGTITFEGRN
ncbi:MAG TPA: FlgD immunoglobulin-like domain containing protein [Planctomycetota bacterium]|nr:FlgD immunoglobulin-like domain containing protein [Planctomycetota bacterium]